MAGLCAGHVDEAGRTSRGPGAGDRHDCRNPLGEFCATVANSAAARRIIKVGGSMTDGEKSGDNKVGPSWFFILLGIIIPLLIVFWLGRLQGVEAQYRVDATARDARVAAADAAELCKNAGDRMVSCLRREIAAAEKEGHDAQDLTAQQQAAWAGMFNVVVGLLSAAGALIGLFWIKATLEATRQTLKEAKNANEISEKAIRAWLSIADVDSVSCGLNPAQELDISYSFRAKNCGNYPALFAAPFGIVTDRAQIRDHILNRVEPFLDMGIKDLGWSDAIAPDSANPYRLSTKVDLSHINYANSRSTFTLWILVRYKTNFVELAYSIFEYNVSIQASPSMLRGGLQTKAQVALKSSHMI